jgi:hypothetical protein
VATELGGKGPHQGEAESAFMHIGRAFMHIGRKANTVILDADPETAVGVACNELSAWSAAPLRSPERTPSPARFSAGYLIC